jgi:hypothetical protein
VTAGVGADGRHSVPPGRGLPGVTSQTAASRRFVLALTTSAALLLLGAPAVDADCSLPLPIPEAMAEADVTLVGHVIDLQNDGRWATVRVEEVWAGNVGNQVVEVRGGGAPGSGSSVDRAFAPDTRYLFLLTVFDGELTDNACSSTTAWVPDLARFRPAAAVAPGVVEQSTRGPALDVGAVVGPVVGVAIIGLIVFGAVVALRPRS